MDHSQGVATASSITEGPPLRKPRRLSLPAGPLWGFGTRQRGSKVPECVDNGGDSP